MASHLAADLAGAVAFAVDLADLGSVAAMVADVESVVGRVDVLVQAAGWDREGRPSIRERRAV
jgi:NAD(P)-dependent dehydrogenase (short-subunit alcohol dehydrogenase family)